EVGHAPPIRRALEARAVTRACLGGTFDDCLCDEFAFAAGYPIELRQVVPLVTPGIQRLTRIAIPAEAPRKFADHEFVKGSEIASRRCSADSLYHFQRLLWNRGASHRRTKVP